MVTTDAAGPAMTTGPVRFRLSDATRWLPRGGWRELALVPILVGAFVIGSSVSDAFLTKNNILYNILGQASTLSILLVAQSMILISGKFDLSMESVAGLAPMVGAWLLVPKALGGSGLGLNVYLAIAATLLVGAAIGVFNGFLVVKLGMNAFIVTLAMLILLRGVTLGVTNGRTLSGLPSQFLYLGSASLLGVPVNVWLLLVLFLAAGLFLRYHRIGRSLYAIGGNPEAARAAGIRVERVLWGLYIVGGILAAVAGLTLSGRIASVTANQGTNLIFSVFAAAVIGGISLDGGKGTMFGGFTGVLLLMTITNILTLSRIPSFWIDASYGAVILLALLLSRATSGRGERT
jgi:simple sugar transport system permease protein